MLIFSVLFADILKFNKVNIKKGNHKKKANQLKKIDKMFHKQIDCNVTHFHLFCIESINIF